MALFSLERPRGTKKVTWFTVLGIILVPLAIGGLLVWALWNPTERLDNITAAVVNNDTPVQLNGQTVPLGRQLASGLVTGGETTSASAVANVSGSDSSQNFTWVLTDADDAASGLASGEYATVVTIPSNFSAAATSFSGDAADAVQATIDIATSDKSKLVDGAISATVTSTATKLLNTQLTTSYLENVYVGFNTLHDQLGTAAEGAGSLADGATQLGTGASTLADGTGTLATGIDTLASGAGDLSSGIGELATGAGGLQSGLQQVADGLTSQAAAATAQQPQTQALADGAQALSDGITNPTSGLGAGVSGLNDGVAGVQSYSVGMLDGFSKLAALCVGTPEEAGDPVSCAALQGAITAQQRTTAPTEQEVADQVPPSFTYVVNQTAQGASALNTAVNGDSPTSLVNSVPVLAGGVQQLVAGVNSSASGLGTLAGTIQQIADGAGQLATGATSAADGASQLADGATSAADGAAQLATGTQSLADGANQLGTGANSLSDGLDSAVTQLPTYTDAERTKLADVVADPVASGSDTVALFGAGSTPFFSSVALWLGALATFLVIGAFSSRALTSTRSSLGLAIDSYVPALLIGVVQGIAVAIVMAFVAGMDLGTWLGFTLMSMLAGAAFASVNQGLVALLGGIGRFISMIVVVFSLGAGIISTAPSVFDDVLAFVPLSTALDGMQAIVNGTGGAARAAVVLVIWALFGLALTVAAIARRRALTVAQLATI
ncbi:YhgE/Pip domain-containing protein [Microbacteriaceae bacterium VKM Ac-2854]|nr:YhgE/Pip domain-containing protein [Microbacteriaceae bacterium VKM Ac-2854]